MSRDETQTAFEHSDDEGQVKGQVKGKGQVDGQVDEYIPYDPAAEDVYPAWSRKVRRKGEGRAGGEGEGEAEGVRVCG